MPEKQTTKFTSAFTYVELKKKTLLSKLYHDELPHLDLHFLQIKLQSTLVIMKLKGPSETLRDIRTSTYQICRFEENTNQTSKFHK